MTNIRQPITVHADADGITIRGQNDINPASGANGEDFTYILFNHAEVVLLDTHLRFAQDDHQDADPIGTLHIDGRLVGTPQILVRVRLTLSDTDSTQASSEVFLGGEVHDDDRALEVTLNLETLTALRSDLAAAVHEVPAESEFHVWADQPGRAFDPSGGRDWIFANYAAPSVPTGPATK